MIRVLELVKRCHRAAALVLLNSVLTVCAANLVAWAIPRALRPQSGLVRDPDGPYYRAQPWTAAFLRDTHAGSVEYRPFTLWRRASQRSETVNIDERGIRKTAGSDCGGDSIKVFMFGGSTLWGIGAPDWGTIPSYLREILHAAGIRACVINFGERGWVSTQGLIALIQELKKGNKPDLVLFYDGVNDVFVAYQNERGDAHMHAQELKKKIETPFPALDLLQWAFRQPLELLGYASKDDLAVPPKELTESQLERLSSDLVQNYLGNYEVLEHLAISYGFKFKAFWQPELASSDKAPTPLELEIKKAIPKSLTELYKRSRRKVVVAGRPNIHDLSHVFDKNQDQVYFDFCHVNPPANQLLAESMYRALRGELGGLRR